MDESQRTVLRAVCDGTNESNYEPIEFYELFNMLDGTWDGGMLEEALQALNDQGLVTYQGLGGGIRGPVQLTQRGRQACAEV